MEETEMVPVPPDELRRHRHDGNPWHCHGWRLHKKELC
ncbi:hypothetical protein Pint_13801 [Pistacia integerrima]|uniref:Uncharacterized protein n=1 Tax=Pistacia integerrima TaxID=434235 RepID=A0ACC0Y3Q0_9ROSI|nr:hypothetical protein Pint_13801 [Pistacia integerrima]